MPTEPLPMPSTHNHHQRQPPTKMTKIKSWQPVNDGILYTSMQLNYDWICGCGSGGRSGGSDADQVCKINFARTSTSLSVHFYCSVLLQPREPEKRPISREYIWIYCICSVLSFSLTHPAYVVAAKRYFYVSVVFFFNSILLTLTRQ